METKIFNKFGIVVAVFAALSLTGCKDSFLEVEPGTKTTSEEYFVSDTHLFEAVVASYHPMRLFDWNGSSYNPLNICSEVMADNFWTGGADLNDFSYWHHMEDYKADALHTLDGIWRQCYIGIKNSNDVISYVNNLGDKLDASKKNLFTVEAKVLRDFYYCQLWKFYGYIPVYMKNLRAPYTCPQDSPDSVYNKVIIDLESAISLNALPMQWDDANLGRISQAMAYML